MSHARCKDTQTASPHPSRGDKPSRNVLLAALAASLLLLVTKSAWTADFVVQPVDVTRLSALPQHPISWARAENDLGEVPDDLVLTNLIIVLRRSSENQAAFEEFLRQQQDPTSPYFHYWLTPAEVGEWFGASSNDIAAVIDWLQSQGLDVDAVSKSRFWINFSGTAVNVGAAFASRLHSYNVDGEQRIAPAGIPQIPVALADIIQGVRGLVSVDERPHHRFGSAQGIEQAAAAITPNASFTCSGGVPCHFIFPADFATIYDLNPAYQQGINGAGQTIAIVGRNRVYLPDIENFQSISGLPIKDPVIVVPPNGTDPGPAASSGGDPGAQAEATLDITRAGSVAPGATILLVVSAKTQTSGGIDVASQYVVDNRAAQIMNISFGGCEANSGQAGVAFWDSIFSQGAVEGISVFVSSGDQGAAECDKSFSTPPASQIASPNEICSSSYATCVGGTEFAELANSSAYWSPTNSNVYGSALGYIPEGAWNEPMDSKGNPTIAASGGGVSMYIATPFWQTGPGVPGTQGRYTPDVSFSAAGPDDYFLCFAATGANCIGQGGTPALFNGNTFVGTFSYGTSAAAPDMAGIAALLNQKMGGAQGNLNPRLYALAATPGNTVFHDVTVTSSGVAACTVSTPSMCNNSTPGPTSQSGGLAGYLVGPGYDEVTGLGSIDVANLLAQWSGGSSTVCGWLAHLAGRC